MKKVLITICTPTRNNYRAASALPFHLILGDLHNAKSDEAKVDYIIYSFNSNRLSSEQIRGVECELGARIVIIEKPKWLQWMFRLHLVFLRILFRYPLMAYLSLPDSTIDEIKASMPDTVWIYGEEISGVASEFKGLNTIVTMPDCESLFYYRMLSKRFVMRNILSVIKNGYAYYQYLCLERDKFCQGVKYHFVGLADRDFYKSINPAAQAVFLNHPLYDSIACERLKEHFSSPIKLLIAGKYDVYMQEASDETLKMMVACADEIKQYYAITFLGKGWEDWNGRLLQAGFLSETKSWVENYAEEVGSHDIQLTPISVGTGTKGKVLDAISNGLLEIGTEGALENIDVTNGESCVIYSSVDELLAVLKEIPFCKSKYELIRKKGYAQVSSSHDKCRIASLLFAE